MPGALFRPTRQRRSQKARHAGRAPGLRGGRQLGEGQLLAPHCLASRLRQSTPAAPEQACFHGGWSASSHEFESTAVAPRRAQGCGAPERGSKHGCLLPLSVWHPPPAHHHRPRRKPHHAACVESAVYPRGQRDPLSTHAGSVPPIFGSPPSSHSRKRSEGAASCMSQADESAVYPRGQRAPHLRKPALVPQTGVT